ncbi:MAG: carboxypeptidase-like regulatory domain-containing protein [Candidatus Bathyarchaeia archaeon]
MTYRGTFFRGFLLVALVLILLSPSSAFANKAMFMQATLNPTQTNQGISVVITGTIFDINDIPVSNAVISIQVTNPQVTSIHLAVAYSAKDGTFQDSFVIAANSPGGNYTAYMVADKPGYDTARVTLSFNYSSPDFSMQASTIRLTLRQGDTGKVTVTVLSFRNFNEPVNLTALNLPSGVTVRFTPVSLTPSGNAEVTVVASRSAQIGNFTITLVGISGPIIHTVSFQLEVTPGPIQTTFIVVPAVLVCLLIGAGLFQRRRRRSRKRAALEELLKATEADKGYVATARVIARLEELRATDQIDESTYQKLKREYEKRLEKSR